MAGCAKRRIQIMTACLLLLLPLLQSEAVEVDGWTVRLRALLARTVVKSDSREYDSGDFSGLINLHDDADLSRWMASGIVEVEDPRWRFSFTYSRATAERTLEEPLTFEEKTFPAGTRLHTTMEAAWLDGLYRLDLGIVSPGAGSLNLLLGLSAFKIFFDFEGNGTKAVEGHSELWPVPMLGTDGDWKLGDSFSLRGRILVSRFSYTNPFHHDGDDDPKLVLGFFRGELGGDWRLSKTWSIGAGLQGFIHRLRDTSEEDRHRVWFEGLGLYLELGAAF